MTPQHSDPQNHRENLEESFFSKPSAKLREELRRAEHDRTTQMETLAAVSGIEDIAVLEKLALLGIGHETLAALTLYPLVAVAWADGNSDHNEREAVLEAARECGLEPSGVSYRLLAEWLEHRPDSLLLAAWKGFIAEISQSLTAEWRETLEREILKRARAVANASGGFLALDKTSGVEQQVLEELIAAFAQGPR